MIAGHIGWFRRVAGPEPFELWIVEIDGVRIVITMRPWRGASEAVLAEAHAIVDSLRYQPSTLSSHGFRLVFRLSAGDWHFG